MADPTDNVQAPRAPIKWLAGFCTDNADVILSMFCDDMLGFEEIAARITAEVKEFTVTPSALRFAFLSDPQLAGAYSAAYVDRAHALVEQAIRHANNAAASGDQARAAELKLKIAAKYSPRHYGDKIEVAGGLGGGTAKQLTTTVGVPDHVLEAMVTRQAGTRV